MKFLRTKIGKVLLVAASVLIVAFLWSFGRDLYWRLNPDAAFRAITGRELPIGVRAMAYTHKLTDNLFHTTHYWLLEGSPSALLQVTNGTDFEESDDAFVMAPDLRRMFGVSIVSTQIVAGYEWELDRDRWYCIFAGRTNAFYAH